MSFATKNFYGEIEKRNAYSFLAGLNYDLKTAAERIECVNKALYLENGYQHPFWERIFEQTFDEDTGLNSSYVKLVLNSTDGLYTDTNICEVLTKMADYILFAEDVKAEDKANKQEYKIYTDARLFQKSLKEISLEGELERVGADTDGDKNIDDLIHILVKEKNGRSSTDQRIFTGDYEDEEMGEILKNYQHQINYMVNNLAANKETIAMLDALLGEKEGSPEFEMMKEVTGVNNKEEAKEIKVNLARKNKLYVKHIGMSKQDLIDVKDMIKRPVRLKALMNGHSEPDFTSTDFMDEEVIKATLSLPIKECYDLQDDYEVVLHYINELIKDTYLTLEQEEVLRLYRSGLKQVEIARVVFGAPLTCATDVDRLRMDLAKKKVERTLDKIAERVTDTYIRSLKEYLVKRKPQEQLKVCSKCGKTKLKSDFYADTKGKDGLRNECVSCK